ncbi:hypothetical protein N824_20900 [Pedobacter sp. V48]|nr:hypothetical protein N824_20900 [Pedobacter sp. V48]
MAIYQTAETFLPRRSLMPIAGIWLKPLIRKDSLVENLTYKNHGNKQGK